MVFSKVVEPLVVSVALEVPVKPLTMIVSVGPKSFTVPANAVPAVICRVFAVVSVKVTSSFAATVAQDDIAAIADFDIAVRRAGRVGRAGAIQDGGGGN